MIGRGLAQLLKPSIQSDERSKRNTFDKNSCRTESLNEHENRLIVRQMLLSNHNHLPMENIQESNSSDMAEYEHDFVKALMRDDIFEIYGKKLLIQAQDVLSTYCTMLIYNKVY